MEGLVIGNMCFVVEIKVIFIKGSNFFYVIIDIIDLV